MARESPFFLAGEGRHGSASEPVLNPADGTIVSRVGLVRFAWDNLVVGGVCINDYPTFRIDNMPYGGVKDSGLGREGVRYAIAEVYTGPRRLAVNGNLTAC